MSEPPRFSQELRPYVDRHEAEAVDRVADRLRAERPAPRSKFRSELRAVLSESYLRTSPRRRRRLGRLVAAYAGSGLFLLCLAALGVAGVGPLAA